MAGKTLSGDDFAAIQALMGKYQQLVDAGDEAGWAALFTADGAFLGLADEQGSMDGYRGQEGLKKIPRLNMTRFGGNFRHNLCSFSAEYGDSRDEVFARYYVLGTLSGSSEGTRLVMQVDVDTHLLRINGEWKIKANRMHRL